MPRRATFHALVRNLMALGARCTVFVLWLVASGLYNAVSRGDLCCECFGNEQATVDSDRGSAGEVVLAPSKESGLSSLQWELSALLGGGAGAVREGDREVEPAFGRR